MSNGVRFGRKEGKSRSEIEIVFTSDDVPGENTRGRVGDFDSVFPSPFPHLLPVQSPEKNVGKQNGTPGLRETNLRPAPAMSTQYKREKSAISSRTLSLARPIFPCDIIEVP